MRSLVSPSLHVTGSVYFSVRTSTPAARNAPTPHSTALAISGDPVTRPPISSVSRRRFSSRGDDPITIGRIFAAASAQDDASVAEQPVVPFVSCPGISVFCFVGGIWACTGTIEAKRRRSREMRKIVRCGMSWFSFLKSLSEALVPGCGAHYTEGSLLIACFPLDAPRLVLWSGVRIDKAIRDACDLHHFYYVVNTHKVGPLQDARSNCCSGAPDTIFRGSGLAVLGQSRAKEAFARSAHEQRIAELRQFREFLK